MMISNACDVPISHKSPQSGLRPLQALPGSPAVPGPCCQGTAHGLRIVETLLATQKAREVHLVGGWACAVDAVGHSWPFGMAWIAGIAVLLSRLLLSTSKRDQPPPTKNHAVRQLLFCTVSVRSFAVKLQGLSMPGRLGRFPPGASWRMAVLCWRAGRPIFTVVLAGDGSLKRRAEKRRLRASDFLVM